MYSLKMQKCIVTIDVKQTIKKHQKVCSKKEKKGEKIPKKYWLKELDIIILICEK